ncbi:TlpA family protein disulfide reductase [Dokdonia sinensis]|nr:redoxin domain-containing protein [Dokdonia sinensis]
MGKQLLLALLFIATLVSGQSNQIFFSESLDAHLPKYIQDAEVAIRNKQQDRIKVLFQELVDDALIGTYMNDFSAKNLNKNEKSFSDFEKPVVLLTYSAWCIPSKGELPALNDLAKQYKKEIDIVVLFWDDHKTVRKATRDYHRNINVLYVDEKDNSGTHIIKNLKHSLGLPLVFTLNSKKEIINIQRRIANKMSVSDAQSYEENHALIRENITQLLFHQSKIDETIPVASF